MNAYQETTRAFVESVASFSRPAIEIIADICRWASHKNRDSKGETIPVHEGVDLLEAGYRAGIIKGYERGRLGWQSPFSPSGDPQEYR